MRSVSKGDEAKKVWFVLFACILHIKQRPYAQYMYLVQPKNTCIPASASLKRNHVAAVHCTLVNLYDIKNGFQKSSPSPPVLLRTPSPCKLPAHIACRKCSTISIRVSIFAGRRTRAVIPRRESIETIGHLWWGWRQSLFLHACGALQGLKLVEFHWQCSYEFYPCSANQIAEPAASCIQSGCRSTLDCSCLRECRRGYVPTLLAHS